jgi:hypothetical protein
MKKLLTLILMAICIASTAQSDEKLSYVSPKKDTLMLLNDSFGKLIAKAWDGEKKKPIIVFADQSVIDNKNARLQLVSQKQNKK